MEQDKLVECNRCGGNACYEQNIDTTTKTWLCMGCGFTTSTKMLAESKLVADLLETQPELYRDLLFTDSTNKVWAPATLTLPGMGMVFIDGTSKENWGWTAVKAIELTEEEKSNNKHLKDQTHKMDMSNASKFGQREFMDACEVIGFFNIG